MNLKGPLEELLSKYCIGGSLEDLSEAVWARPGTKAMIEKAQWLMHNAPVPTLKQIVLIVTLAAHPETPRPVIFALMAAFVKLHQALEAHRSADQPMDKDAS